MQLTRLCQNQNLYLLRHKLKRTAHGIWTTSSRKTSFSKTYCSYSLRRVLVFLAPIGSSYKPYSISLPIMRGLLPGVGRGFLHVAFSTHPYVSLHFIPQPSPALRSSHFTAKLPYYSRTCSAVSSRDVLCPAVLPSRAPLSEVSKFAAL